MDHVSWIERAEAVRPPLSMQKVAALGTEAGLPAGAFNVLSGDGVTVGRRLGEHPDVDVLTFTGSTPVGRHFLRYAGDSNLQRVHLELGGKSPNIVFPDAPDLGAAAAAAAWAAFFNAGQMCTAGARLLVHRSVSDQVVEAVVAAADRWRPADLGRAHRVSRAMRAGTVWVNCYEEGDMSVPFGGVKLSGSGRDKSRHAMDQYTDLKTVWINHG